MSKKTCLSCSNFLGCSRDEKSPVGKCEDWAKRKHISIANEILSEFNHSAQGQGTPDYDALELDLEALLETIVDPNTKMLRDLKIDDADFREFPNIADFIMSKDGLHLSPFSRQLWMHVVMFHEFCPDCTRKKKWMRNILNCPIDLPAEEFKDYVQLLHNGKCPKCGKTKLDFFKAKSLAPYQEFGALLGQRVGKSTMLVAPAATYALHKYMKVPRPWELFGLNPTTLFSTLVAQTYAAASDQLWLPVKTYLEASPWFIEYHKMLTDTQMRSGEELFSFTTTQLHYRHRALMVYPSGPNRKTLRGKTRFFSATDEFDFFDGNEDSEAVKMNGKEVRTSLNNSLANVRIGWREVVEYKNVFNVPTGISMYVSSPDHAMGVLTRHVAAKETSRTILALNLATWEVHPKLTKKAIIKAFDPDPIRLERDFGAKPPLNASPFIEDPAIIEKMAVPDRPNRVEIVCESKVKNDRQRLVPRVVRMRVPATMRRSVLAIDAGLSNNSFAAAVLSPGMNNTEAHSRRVTVHALIEIMALRGMGTIDFNAVYRNVFTPIIQNFNVGALVADQWNSQKILDDAAADFDIFVDKYSLRYNDFTLVRSYMESGSFQIPQFVEENQQKRLRPDLTKYPACFNGRPVDHFFFQALTVRDTHKSVDKGMGLTDDLWRSVVLGSRFVLDDEFSEKYLRGTEQKKNSGGVVAGSYMAGVNAFGVGAQKSLGAAVAAASASSPSPNSAASIPGVFVRIRQ